MGFHTEFVKELNLFLLSRRVCATLDKAEDLSFVLLVSAKGLLLNTWARKYFDAGMGRVIATVVDNHWHRTGSVAADRQAATAGLQVARRLLKPRGEGQNIHFLRSTTVRYQLSPAWAPGCMR